MAWYLAGVSYGQMNQGSTLQLNQILGDTDLTEARIIEAGARASLAFPSVISMGGGGSEHTGQRSPLINFQRKMAVCRW